MAKKGGTELAVAYLTLIPSLRDARKRISEGLSSPEAKAAARRAGEQLGDEVQRGMGSPTVTPTGASGGAAGAAGAAASAGAGSAAAAGAAAGAAAAGFDQGEQSARRFKETVADTGKATDQLSDSLEVVLAGTPQGFTSSSTEVARLGSQLRRLGADGEAVYEIFGHEILGRDDIVEARLAGERIGQEVKAGIDRQRLSASLLEVGAGLTAAGAVGAVGLYKMAQAAGDLGEAVSKASVVLGEEGASAIQEFADSAAKSAGLSRRAAVDGAAGFAVMGKAAGLTGDDLSTFSIQLTQLAGDMASFNNVTPDEALVAIAAGLRNESEPLRRLGVTLDELTLKERARKLEIYDGTGVMTQAQKVIAAYAEILAQTGDQQGDFVRTSDSLANQTRILTAEFENFRAQTGELLVPVFSQLTSTASGALSAFAELPQPVQSAGVALVGLGSTAALLFGGGGLLVGGTMRAVDSYKQLASAISGASGAAGVFARIGAGGGIALGVVAGLFALEAAIDQVAGGARQLEEAFIDLQAAGTDFSQSQAVDKAIEGALKNQISLDNLTGNFSTSEARQDAFNEALEQSVPLARQFLDTIRNGEDVKIIDPDEVYRAEELRDKVIITTDEIERMERAIRRRRNADVESARGQLEYNEELREALGLTDSYKSELRDAGEETRDLSTALKELSARQRLTALGFDANAAASDSFRSALDRAAGGASLLSAGLSMGGALAELRKGLFGDPDDLTDPIEELAKQVNPAQEALDRLSDAADRADPSMTALGISLDSTSAAADAFRDALEDSSWMDDLAGHAISIGRAFKDMRLNLRNLPPTFDLARASLGQYEDGQLDAIQSMFQLGESTQDYLATLMRSGRPLDDMRAEAGRLRDAFMAQFTAMGLTTEQAQEYLAMLGLTPDQIETSIKLSGAEKARFQVNAYLQLLEGRIPPEVATNVAALIEQGDLDSAAAALADWAKTGPGKVDISLWDPQQADDAKADLAQLPGVIDPIKAAMGGYNDEQMRGIELALAFGDTTREVLAKLVAEGRGDEVPAVLASAKEEFTAIGLQAGLSREAIDGLWDSMGLNPGTVETALKVSGVDKALFQIQTYVDLLGDEIPPEVASQVLAAVDEGNLDEAARILNEWRVNNPQVFESGVNTDQAQTDLFQFTGGANQLPPIELGLSLNMDEVQRQILAVSQMEGSSFWDWVRGRINPFKPGGGSGGGGGGGGSWATGGLIPGVGNTDSVPAMLMPGEFVVRKEMVKRLGLDFMHRLNSGALPGFAAGGEVPRYFGMPGARDAAYARLRGVERPRYMTATTELAGGARSGGVTVDIDATYNQVERAPSADELARRVREELVVGGYG